MRRRRASSPAHTRTDVDGEGPRKANAHREEREKGREGKERDLDSHRDVENTEEGRQRNNSSKERRRNGEWRAGSVVTEREGRTAPLRRQQTPPCAGRASKRRSRGRLPNTCVVGRGRRRPQRQDRKHVRGGRRPRVWRQRTAEEGGEQRRPVTRVTERRRRCTGDCVTRRANDEARSRAAGAGWGGTGEPAPPVGGACDAGQGLVGHPASHPLPSALPTSGFRLHACTSPPSSCVSSAGR